MNNKLIFTAALLGITACGGNMKTIKQEEVRYQQEFPGRELPLVPLAELPAARDLVPESREHAYALDARAGVEGDYYVFTLFTPHGAYTVKSLFALTEACREARIVEMFLTSPYSARLQQQMGEYFSPAKAPRGTMFVSPVDSIRGLGRSFHQRYMEWENNYVSPDKHGSHPLDGINRATPSAGARTAAYRLRADAWSENPALAAMLRALAQDGEAAAALLPGGHRFFVPCGESGWLTPADFVPAWGDKWPAPGGKSAQAERFLRDGNPGEIKRVLREFYADNLQLDEASCPALQQLLDNAAYSPRQQVYIAWYLAHIKARNPEEALNYLTLARTAFRAAYNMAQLEMLHAVHSYYAPVERFAALQNQLGAITRGRRLVVIPLWDHTRQRTNVRHLLMEIRNFGENYNLQDLQLWFTGDVDQSVVKTGADNRITVRERVANLDMFRFTTLRALTYRPQPGDPSPQNTVTVKRDPVVYRERTSRPRPVHTVPAKKYGEGKITIESDKPGWNGRLAIEKPLPEK